jgi:hypothetical protein
VVHRLDEVDDVQHGTVGHRRRDVARDGVRQGRPDVGHGKLLRPGPLAVQDIAVALDKDVPGAQHGGQLADFLRVGDGLVEGLVEVVGAEDGEVGVVGLEVFVGMTVHDGEVVVVVFLADEAARVLAERAHLVFKRLRIADQLGLVEHAVDKLHDLVAHLDPDADVHGAGLVGDAVFLADLFHPVRAAPSGRDHDVGGEDLKVFMASADLDRGDAGADVPLQDNIGALVFKQDLHAVLQQVVLDVQIDLLRALRAEVPDRAVDQLQTGLDGPFADLLDLIRVPDPFDMLIRAEGEIDLVGIIDQILRKIGPISSGSSPPTS